jgi:hypothetical protein
VTSCRFSVPSNSFSGLIRRRGSRYLGFEKSRQYQVRVTKGVPEINIHWK